MTEQPSMSPLDFLPQSMRTRLTEERLATLRCIADLQAKLAKLRQLSVDERDKLIKDYAYSREDRGWSGHVRLSDVIDAFDRILAEPSEPAAADDLTAAENLVYKHHPSVRDLLRASIAARREAR